MPKYYIQNGKCGTECAFKIIGAKWKPNIIHYCVEHEYATFSALKNTLGTITDTTLSRKLSELLKDEILERTEIAGKSGFILTEKARKLLPIMKEMHLLAVSCGYTNAMDNSSVEYAGKLIGSKWKSRIIWAIYNYGIVRFNELQNSIEDISHKILAEQLESLIKNGVIIRTDYYEKRPKVEYTLTTAGKQAYSIIQHLSDWCIEYKLIKPSIVINY